MSKACDDSSGHQDAASWRREERHVAASIDWLIRANSETNGSSRNVPPPEYQRISGERRVNGNQSRTENQQRGSVPGLFRVLTRDSRAEISETN